MSKIQTPSPIRGMQSLLGDEADRFHAVVDAFEKVRRLFGFKRVEVPVLEPTAVFARTMGETTDVVSKEMYSFEDKSGDNVTLRPEFTAGIARAFITEGWQQYSPLKVATHGPAFRYERPQKGRYRQFHQLDVEILGAGEPQADVEVIAFGSQLLDELGLGDSAILKLNTLGDPETRAAWRDALHAHFTKHRDILSDDSRSRLDRNPLRILDSKAHQDWPVADSAPAIDDYLTSEAGAFFDKVTRGLDAAGIKWERNARLVRGIDYYRHTAFEFMTDQLGAQGTVLAGGRYDGLIEQLGGPHTPAIGWAAGIERLAMMIGEPKAEKVVAALIPLGESAEAVAGGLLADLRRAGIAADMAFRGNMKKRLQRADANGARFAIIIGDDEVAAGEAQVKELATGEQRKVPFATLAGALGK